MAVMVRTQEVKQIIQLRFGSLKAFARETGWGEGKVSRLVNDKEPWSWKTLNTMCSLLERQPGDLLRWEPDAN